jgi:WD40 domain-containing protein
VGARVRGAAAAALCLFGGACAPKPPLTPEQLQLLQRGDTYLSGEVKSLRRDVVLDAGGLATAVGGSRHGELVAFATLSGEDAVLTAVDRTGAPKQLWAQKVNAGRRPVEAVEVSPDGSMVVSAGRDGFARAFRGRSGVPGAALGLRQPLTSLALRWDGAQLAVGTAQGRVVVTTFPGLEVVAQAELHGGQEVRGLAYRADGAIVSGGWDRSLVVSRVRGGDLLEERRRAVGQYVNDVQVGGAAVAVALSASASDRPPGEMPAVDDPMPANAAVLLDDFTLEEVVRPVHHHGPVSTVAMAPDGVVFASGSLDGKVLLEQRDAPSQAPLGLEVDWFVRRVRLTRDARWLLVAAWVQPPIMTDQQPAPSVTVEELVRKAPEVVREPPHPE